MGAGAGEVSPVAAGAADIGPLNAANYRITDGSRIGEGGLKQKYRQNVAAIRTLRRVQAESRPPTPEEKSTIAKYVGWGGLPQVFATPEDAPQWRAEQEELAALLESVDLTATADQDRFRAAFDELYDHIAKEEDGLFPASLTALDGDAWDTAILAWRRAHPGAEPL